VQAYLVQAHNLAVGLLDLAQLGEEVPEARLGDDIVRGEDAHAVELWGRVGVRGQIAPNDLVFLQATCRGTESALSYGALCVCAMAVVLLHLPCSFYTGVSVADEVCLPICGHC
jgi:hypothetical protein